MEHEDLFAEGAEIDESAAADFDFAAEDLTLDDKKKKADGKNPQQPQTDPDKIADVMVAAGVDLKEEEALLAAQNAVAARTTKSYVVPDTTPFLHPTTLLNYIGEAAKSTGGLPMLDDSEEVLSLLSDACEHYMRDILTNAIILSRHRKRSVRVQNGRRSEVTRTLREMAIRQKEQESKRYRKRVNMGLEKPDDNKLDPEETLHRASNATANLMISTGSKKKYGWLTAGGGAPSAATSVNSGKVSTAMAARGDVGIRYREAREEPGIVMRDLLGALETKRMGVEGAITKGYARLRD